MIDKLLCTIFGHKIEYIPIEIYEKAYYPFLIDRYKGYIKTCVRNKCDINEVKKKEFLPVGVIKENLNVSEIEENSLKEDGFFVRIEV